MKVRAGCATPVASRNTAEVPGIHVQTQEIISATALLPPNLVQLLADLPNNVDRRTGAELVTKHLFPVSHRTLKARPSPDTQRQRQGHPGDRHTVRACVCHASSCTRHHRWPSVSPRAPWHLGASKRNAPAHQGAGVTRAQRISLGGVSSVGNRRPAPSTQRLRKLPRLQRAFRRLVLCGPQPVVMLCAELLDHVGTDLAAIDFVLTWVWWTLIWCGRSPVNFHLVCAWFRHERLHHDCAARHDQRLETTPSQHARRLLTAHLPSGMTLYEVSVHTRDATRWVAPASKPVLSKDGTALRDADGKIRYTPIIAFVSKTARSAAVQHRSHLRAACDTPRAVRGCGAGAMMKCIAGIDPYFAALEPVLDDAGCEVDTDMPSLDVLGGHAIPVRNLPVMAGTIGCVWLVVEGQRADAPGCVAITSQPCSALAMRCLSCQPTALAVTGQGDSPLRAAGHLSIQGAVS